MAHYLEHLFEKYLRHTNSIVVQIGSHDGIYDDPLFNIIKNNTNIHTLFVEPVPYLFEKLKINYGTDNRFKFENCAINNGSNQTFYWVPETVYDKIPNLPPYICALNSFNKQHILNFVDGALEPYIVELNIKGLTLNELFEKHSIHDITLLHIDTEGYDWIVLSQLDLLKYKPTLIVLEHLHLNDIDKQHVISFLNETYYIIQFIMDYVAINKQHILADDLLMFNDNTLITIS